MALPIANPHPVTANPVIVRARGVLPAAGVFDATPTEFSVAGFDRMMLYVTYDRDAAAPVGAATLRIETSPYALNAVAPQESWFQAALYAAGVLAPGADVTSNVQREFLRYQATGAAPETFVYGPLNLQGTVERIRIAAAESGTIASPGICEIVGVLYE